MSIKFEQTYLKTILSHIDSLESVKKFIQINKKCQEVSTAITTYRKCRRADYDFEHERMIPSNLLTIFTNTKTIYCNEKDLLQHKEIMNQMDYVQVIHLIQHLNILMFQSNIMINISFPRKQEQ